jgi:WD40 repeat protein
MRELHELDARGTEVSGERLDGLRQALRNGKTCRCRFFRADRRRSSVRPAAAPVREDDTHAAVVELAESSWSWAEGLKLRITLEDRDHAVAFSPDGKTLASEGRETIRLWDVVTGKNTATLTGHTAPMAFSPDGRMLAATGTDDTIRLWDMATWKNTATLQGHSGRISSLAFSPDGSALASAAGDETIRLWRVPSGEKMGSLNRPYLGDVWSMAFSPDGRTLATVAVDMIGLWDVPDRRIAAILNPKSTSIYTVAFSPDGKTVGSLGYFPDLPKLWDVASGTNTTLDARRVGGSGLAFSPDGKTVAFGVGGVELWDVATRRKTATLDADSECLAFSPDGKTLAAAGYRVITLWDVDRVKREK